jgi:hypothetical protein
MKSRIENRKDEYEDWKVTGGIENRKDEYDIEKWKEELIIGRMNKKVEK